MLDIRLCADGERADMLAIVNAAAQRYHGAIPRDRWREPYMSREELDHEIASGVVFWGAAAGGDLVGVMGVQPVSDVVLIRHAYVEPSHQGEGVGGRLLAVLREGAAKRMLVGTWAAADWAVRFYERHGFTLVPTEEAAPLLRRYWTVPERQIETSVVLSSSPASAGVGAAAQ